MSVKDQVQDLLNNAQYQNALAFCMLTDSPKEDIQLIEERCVHFVERVDGGVAGLDAVVVLRHGSLRKNHTENPGKFPIRAFTVCISNRTQC